MYGNLSVQQNPAAEAHVQSDQRAKQARQLIVTGLYLGLVTLLVTLLLPQPIAAQNKIIGVYTFPLRRFRHFRTGFFLKALPTITRFSLAPPVAISGMAQRRAR